MNGNMQDPKTICQRWSKMTGDRAPWDGIWQEVSDYAVPRKVPQRVANNTTGIGSNAANRLYDVTAIEAVSILASGHSSAITPAGTQWFAWEAPDSIKSDEADAWYNDCSEKARNLLAQSNFHTMLNEAFEDRAGFGICCLGAMPSATRTITFQAHPVGCFCLEEDVDGDVDTVFMRRPYSIRQLVQQFGEEVVGKNTVLGKAWEDWKSKGYDSDHSVIHAVFPRLERDSSKMDALNMAFASCWVAEEGQSMLLESGFEELPFCVSRYLKHSGSRQQYGYSPFEQVRAAVIGANRTKQILQVVGQKLAVPPILVPDNLVGNVDTRPGGKTIFKASSGVLPKEWLSGGNPQGMAEELEDDRKSIRDAYHTDLFRMFVDREKQMTAREVSELAAEKLMPFSPSFTRFTADFQVMMDRIFSIMFRAGVFGEVNASPQAVIVQRGDFREVPPPKVVYQSRVALAIRQAETAAADRLVERAMGLAQMNPGALDNIDMDAYLRTSARNDGVVEKMLRPEKEMQAQRDQRAQAEAQAQQLAQAQQAADAAGKVGVKVPPGMMGGSQ